MDQTRESKFVLVVCTEKYYRRYLNEEEQGQGQGVTWEGGLIIADLYSGQGINEKYIPVLLSVEGKDYIPESLRSYTHYELFDNDYNLNKPGSYQELYRYLTHQPSHVAPPIGTVIILPPKTLPPIHSAPFNVGSDGEITKIEDPTIAQEKEEQPAKEDKEKEEWEELIQQDEGEQVDEKVSRSTTAKKTTPPIADIDNVLTKLILKFLKQYFRWFFNASRIRGWGSEQSGYEGLKQYSTSKINQCLESLSISNKLRTKVSRRGTTLYAIK